MKYSLVLMAVFSLPVGAQDHHYVPVTDQMLRHPSPDDWLMFNRTYDAQRYSPLDEINVHNVQRLRMVWARGFGPGETETIPIVHDGVMYVIAPGAIVEALDATTGDLIWKYRRDVSRGQATLARAKALAIYQDILVYAAPDSYIVGLDARTGKVRWQTKTDTRGNTSGAIVADGKVISGGACAGKRENCYIIALDALTGKEVWRFYTTPARGQPGDKSWNGAPVAKRLASTWGLPGAYDPARKMLYWGVANPMPEQRLSRHGSPDAAAQTTPADLYSNSTLAINVDTGKLAWYYQYLPADDADLDYTNERTLAHIRFEPDPKYVKWINPSVRRGGERDVAAMVAEAGGVYVLDQHTGQFLWATPFPSDSPYFALAGINPKTGVARINWSTVFKHPGETHIICYWNTRSYWPTAYSPKTHSLYTSYIDNCRKKTIAGPHTKSTWKVVPRPGADLKKLTGLAKINLSTGKITRFDVGRAPSMGGVLATAGGLIFHGDMTRRFRAFDAETGKRLWQVILGGNISVSTITYAVNGKQYVAVMTGHNLKVPELAAEFPEIKTPREANAIYAFALP